VRDSEGVKIEDSSGNLMSNSFSSLLRNFEVPRLEIVEEITTLQVLHHDINVIRIFKNIIKPYNIWVLAYLQHLNFSL